MLLMRSCLLLPVARTGLRVSSSRSWKCFHVGSRSDLHTVAKGIVLRSGVVGLVGWPGRLYSSWSRKCFPVSSSSDLHTVAKGTVLRSGVGGFVEHPEHPPSRPQFTESSSKKARCNVLFF